MLRINLFVFILTAIAYLIGIYFFPFMLTSRDVLHQVWVISGVVTWILMTEAIVIAARPSWIERVSGEPLGKLMQAHKTLGWWMVGFAFIHFLAPFVRDIITSFYPVVEVPMMEEHAIHGFWSGVGGVFAPDRGSHGHSCVALHAFRHLAGHQAREEKDFVAEVGKGASDVGLDVYLPRVPRAADA
ncbi:ferric reductase-like transmembrane domain-containing protein [Mesosutterella multiformis]|uniref:ferric reductase-like transmembrane domain-containing protein n=1 Tax=Mesosutterella multiformis TaxID=2259133 RepID=UPI000F60E320|nr:ferric reductase-like transmembrane domain-containing protein [Mesosutterella multiformis]